MATHLIISRVTRTERVARRAHCAARARRSRMPPLGVLDDAEALASLLGAREGAPEVAAFLDDENIEGLDTYFERQLRTEPGGFALASGGSLGGGFATSLASQGDFPTTVVREVQAGSSFLSSEDPRVHFGLGDLATVEELRVRFGDGAVRVLNDVPVDQHLVVRHPDHEDATTTEVEASR